MLGVVLGFLSLLLVLSLGLITVFNQYPIVQTILRILGSLYLLYLAYRIYFSVNTQDDTKSKPITFLESSLFQYVNPKGVMIFFPNQSRTIKSYILLKAEINQSNLIIAMGSNLSSKFTPAQQVDLIEYLTKIIEIKINNF